MSAASGSRPATVPLEEDPSVRPPLVDGRHDFASVTDTVCRIVEPEILKTPKAWWIMLAFSLSLLGLLKVCIVYLVYAGVGVWGNNNPVGWGFDIVNFVFWIGIGHAGTLISAILFLFRQKWRTSINRFAEGMTIFAVMCAGIYPALHTGRPWFDYWLFPHPNQMGMWPNFRSPLMWDVFAVNTYFAVSFMFWYTGMIPDLATLRDRAKSRIAQVLYGIFALGWRGSARHWHHYERVYLILAGLSTPLVLSVHSVVSFDFATSQLPGWHTTIFPPYFVVGAIFGGFAMVLGLLLPCRHWLGLKEIVTERHLDNMAKIMLAASCLIGYAYFMEIFTAWYSGSRYEGFAFENRLFGPYAWAYWLMVFCNVVAPQVFWSKRARRSTFWLAVVAILVSIGMWFERFVIIVTSLHRDFLPSSWGMYWPSWVDLAMFAGSFGLFFTLLLLFIRFVPMIAIAEVKSVMPAAGLDRGPHHGHGQYWGEIPHQHDDQHKADDL